MKKTFVVIYAGKALGFCDFDNTITAGDYIVCDGGVREVYSRHKLHSSNSGIEGVLRVSQDMRTDSDKKLFFENPKS